MLVEKDFPIMESAIVMLPRLGSRIRHWVSDVTRKNNLLGVMNSKAAGNFPRRGIVIQLVPRSQHQKVAHDRAAHQLAANGSLLSNLKKKLLA